jgi:hypothetical protein
MSFSKDARRGRARQQQERARQRIAALPIRPRGRPPLRQERARRYCFEAFRRGQMWPLGKGRDASTRQARDIPYKMYRAVFDACLTLYTAAKHAGNVDLL